MPYSGTGLTAGPFALTLNQSLQCADPHVGVASTSVQVQNSSGFALAVNSGAEVYSITSYQSSTIPVPASGAGITITPVSQQSQSGAASVTLVWMLDGQWPPQPDGALTGGQTITVGQGTFAGSTSSSTTFVVTPPTFASTLQITGSIDVAPFRSVTLTVTGDTTSTVYESQAYGEGANPVDLEFPIDTTADASYTITLTPTGSTYSYSLTVTAIGSGSSVVVFGSSGLPLDVVDYGGLQSANGTVSSTALTPILGAPGAGTCYRLHSFCATTTTQVLDLAIGADQPMAVVTAPGFVLLGGRLANGVVNVKASGASTMAYEVGYDVVTLPTIT
jgi:hypothetical protein